VEQKIHESRSKARGSDCIEKHSSPQGSIHFDNTFTFNNVCISKVLGVEESIWSPLYGLKGKIDVAVEVKVQRQDVVETLLMPLELKTGGMTPMMSNSHRKQQRNECFDLSPRPSHVIFAVDV
jgi:hypothetical protein